MRPDIKYYVVPAVILIGIILIVLILPFHPNQQPSVPISPTDSPSIFITRIPTKRVSITPLPPENSTGVAENQQLAPDVQNLGIQKTELRMKTPVTLSFATISFDYTTDLFLVQLNEPKEQTKTTFEEWLKQTYPAIPLDRFAFE